MSRQTRAGGWIVRRDSAAVVRALIVICGLAVVRMLSSGVGLAAADFGVSGFDGQVSSQDGSPYTQAAGHPFSASTQIDLNFNPVSKLPYASVKDLDVELPPGLVGNPLATPLRCTEAQLEDSEAEIGSSEGCPIDSQVGVAEVENEGFPGAPVAVYNMIPPPGVPAAFGFQIAGVAVHLLARVRSGGDYGLDIEVPDISQALAVTGTQLTLWGVPADPAHDPQRGQCLYGGGLSFSGQPCTTDAPLRPFLTNPSVCSGPVLTTLQADSWKAPGDFQTANFLSHDNSVPAKPLGLTGCDVVPFDPTISVQPSNTMAGAPAGYTVDLHVPRDEDPTGLAQADLRKAVITFPRGVTVSASAAGGLGGCTDGSEGTADEIALHSATPVTCPDASKIGTVEVDTPLLEHPLTGAVYLAAQGNNPFGSLLALYLVAEGSGVVIKLAGRVEADPVSGQLTATFDNNPQLPFEDLKVVLRSGPRAPLVNPVACGTYTTSSQLTSFADARAVDPNSSFQIDEGCTNSQPFDPTFDAGTTTSQAGAFSPLALNLTRGDADQPLGGITVQTPPGLLGMLRSVARCPEPAASQGACGTDSVIGHTTVAAGPGLSPFYLGGTVYLTGPYKGAPFGLSIVVPAVAGPFNLGTVVVRASIAVDARDAHLTIVSDPLPTILQGIPLDLQAVNLVVDRASFMFNPTNCSPRTLSGTISSAQGASAAVSSRFQVSNCETLAFKPKLSASLAAKSSRAGGASFDVKIASGPGQANIGKVKVDLPAALPSRLTTIQKACPEKTFEIDPSTCPPGSQVGTGTAVTPVLAHALTGSAYLVSHGGVAFPDLVVVLKGEGITIDLTGAINITKAGITSSTFANVPDVPISSFELKLPTGPHSALTGNLPAKARGSFCGRALTMPTALTGQNGVQVKQSTKIGVTGCLSKKAKHASGIRRAREPAEGR